MVETERTLLWSAASVAPNNSSITLLDTIDNYDELIYYGSGTRTYSPCVMTEYPVISGVLNLGGPFFFGNWGATDTFVLCNGTQVFLSGTSGYVASSYYWGKNNGSTAYAASLVNNRANDVRPFKIVGVKYPKNYDRTLLWESDHTATLYNTNISLSEPATHFKQIMVLGSGFENGGVGCRHSSKNIYNTQYTIMGCDAWAYTPWKIAERHNLVIGQEMRISGNSGYIGSGYYMGMGNKTTAWAAGKWNTDYQFSATAPYRIYGIDRKPTYNVRLLQTEGGTISVSPNKGYEFDIATLSNTTANENYKFSSYNITGATLTGNEFMWNDNDVQVQGNFEHNKTLTLVNGEHAVLSADKDKGFIGDVVTVTGTMDEGWYLTGFNTTGATMTGNQFAFEGEDVTVEGLYTDEGFPVTYEVQGGGTLTGETIAIPGQPLSIQSAYNTYWRLSGFDITGGYIQNNQIYPSSAPFIVKAVYKPNAFTATGGFEKGSNVSLYSGPSERKNIKYTTVGAKYATRNASTGDIPASWYSTSNRWHPSNASAYKITINAKMGFTGNNSNSNLNGGPVGYVTAVSLLGSTQTQSQKYSHGGARNEGNWSFAYSKSFTSNSQNINYGLSARLGTIGWYQSTTVEGGARSTYVAARTTGGWTATGYAP